MSKPRMFIGSSSEGLEIAKALQVLLDHQFEISLWNQGVFGLSQTAFESLIDSVKRFDFACLALTPDDMVESRGSATAAPRDNVLFELGLFFGALGRARTFLVFDRTRQLKLPSDLAGVTAATFERHSSGNLVSSLGACATQIENHALGQGMFVQALDCALPTAAQQPISVLGSHALEMGPSKPGDERLRYCKNCGDKTIQSHNTSWNIFWTDHYWLCTHCGEIVNYIG